MNKDRASVDDRGDILTNRTVRKRPIVTGVEMMPGGFADWLVYPMGPAGIDAYGEWHLDETEDLENWIARTGLDWDRSAVSELRSHFAAAYDKPTIRNVPPLDELIAESGAAIKKHNDPPRLFHRGGIVSEVAEDEKGGPVVKPVTAARMRERMGEAAYWLSPKAQPQKPPGDVAANLLETPHLHLPRLSMLVEMPILGPDGKIRKRRGYDPSTGTYFAPKKRLVDLVDMPVEDAVLLLREVVQDFPFRTEADRTAWFGLLLTPVLRMVYEGLTPLFAIKASRPGTGKTLLVQAMTQILRDTSQDSRRSERTKTKRKSGSWRCSRRVGSLWSWTT